MNTRALAMILSAARQGWSYTEHEFDLMLEALAERVLPGDPVTRRTIFAGIQAVASGARHAAFVHREDYDELNALAVELSHVADSWGPELSDKGVEFFYLQPVGGGFNFPYDSSKPYKCVVHSIIDRKYVADALSHQDMASELFRLHNTDLRPKRFEIRSMSIGDVIVFGTGTVLLCEPGGWKDITDTPPQQQDFSEVS